MPSFRLTVNGTEREVALPSLSVQHIVNGADILEADIQDELGSEVLSMDDVVILYRTDVSPETVYFEGLLQTTGNETWSGWGFSRLRKITAFDYGVYTSFVTVEALEVSTASPLDTVSSVLSTLVADYLTDYGVTLHPSQATGPTVDPNAWDGDYVEAVLNAVSEQTGWVWKIDALKRLRMFDPATEAAGFNVTATNGTYINDIKTNILRQRYYNRVFVEGGNGYHTFTNEQHFGDGAKTTFLLNAPIHYFENFYTPPGDDVGLTVLVTRAGPVTTVEYVNRAATQQWRYDSSDHSITQVSGAVLGAAEYILIPGYAAQYPMRVVSDGRGSPPAPARDLKVVRPSLFGRAAMQSLADTIRTASQVDFERISYLTDEVDILPGETQTVNVAEAGVNDTYTAINVRLAYVSGGDTSAFRREVTAVNAVTARSFWLDLYRRWLTDNQGVGSSSTTTASIGSSTVPIGPAPPPFSAQYNKHGVFGGAAGSEGAIYMRPDGGGPNQGVPDESALLALEVVDDAIALAIANMVAGRPSALTFRVEDDGSALIEHTDSLGFDIIEYGGQLGLIGATILASPNAASDGTSTGRLAHYWRHDSRAHRRIRITGTSYTIDEESAGGGGTYSAWIFDPTAACTVTLPSVSAFMGLPSSGYGRVLEIRNDSTLYPVTLDGASSELIFRTGTGRLTFPLMPGASVKLIALDSTGAGWKVLAYDLPPIEVTLTNAQIKALPTTPITLIPAPPSGTRIKLHGGSLILETTLGAYTNINPTYAACFVYWLGYTSQWAAAGPVDDATYTPQTLFTQTFGATTDATAELVPYIETPSDGAAGVLWTTPVLYDTSSIDGVAMAIAMDNNGSGDLTGGNAANTLKVRIYYDVEAL